MKILWTCNILFPDLAASLGMTAAPTSGTWIFALAAALAKRADVELGVIAPAVRVGETRKTIGGVTHYVVPRGKWGAVCTCRAEFRRRIAAAIREFRPDLIHVNGTENNFAAAVSELAGDTPVLLQVQGLVSRCAPVFWGGLSLWDVLRYRTLRDWLHLGGMLEQRLLLARLATFELDAIRRAKYVTGQTTWQEAHARAINPDAVFYQYNHVLCEAFFRTHWSLAQARRHVVLAPSAATPLKGLHWLLRAAQLLVKDFPDLTIRVPGFDPANKNRRPWLAMTGYGKYLLHLIRELKLEKHVEFLGPIGGEQMAAEMQRAHLVALASSMESLSNVLSEAMIVGTPCAASFVGGMPSVARHETEALFYPFGDVPLLAESIRRIFEDDALATALSQNARRCARARHQPDDVVLRLLSIYRDITEGGKREAVVPPFHFATTEVVPTSCAGSQEQRV